MKIQGKGIERISIRGGLPPEEILPKDKESIPLNGSPVPNKLNEMFLHKIIKETSPFWRPSHLTKSQITPHQFLNALEEAKDLFKSKLGELESSPEPALECLTLESSINVISMITQDQENLSIVRRLLLKT